MAISNSLFLSSTGVVESAASTSSLEATTPPPTTPSWSDTEGRFFAYASLPMIFCSVFVFFLHLSIFVRGYGWERNPVALVLGLNEPPEESRSTERVLNSHAILGLTGVVLVTFQVVSAILFQGSNKKEEDSLLRQAHRWNGPVAFVIWTTVALVGSVFVFMSQKLKQYPRQAMNFARCVLFLWIGIGTLCNMTIGIMAVASRCQQQRDVVLHKACMFFALNWILSSAFSEVITAVVQYIVHDCYIEGHGLLLCTFGGEFIQLVGFCIAAWYFDSAVLRSKVVRINLLFWFIRTMGIGIALTKSNTGVDPNGCFYREERP